MLEVDPVGSTTPYAATSFLSGRQYLRIICGPEYDAPEPLELLRELASPASATSPSAS